MKKVICVIFYLALTVNPIIAQKLISTIQIGGGNYDLASDVTSDPKGNMYVVGRFYGKCQFNDVTLNSYGYQDGFLAKYDSTRTLLWVKQMGGYDTDQCQGVVVDSSGNCYVTGYYYHMGRFDTVRFNTGGGNRTFTAKYDANGTLKWVKVNPFLSLPYSIAMDSYNNVIITGTQDDATNIKGYVSKYDSSGNILWTQKLSGSGGSYINSVTIDSKNNIYATGIFFNDAAIGNHQFKPTSGGLDSDAFLVKLNPTGSVLFALKIAEGTGTIDQPKLKLDNAGNIFITGGFGGDVDFSGRKFRATSQDMYVNKYDPEGKLLWVVHPTGTIQENGMALAITTLGEAYFSGAYWGTVDFGTQILSSNRGQAGFFGKLSPLGEPLWITSIDSNTQGSCASICINKKDRKLLLAASFNNKVSFGQREISSYGLVDALVLILEDTVRPTITNVFKNEIYTKSPRVIHSALEKKITITELPPSPYTIEIRDCLSKPMVQIENQSEITLPDSVIGLLFVTITTLQSQYHQKIFIE